MRYLIRQFSLSIFIVAVMASLTIHSYALEDAIIAIVNDEVITIKDLRDYIRSTYISLVAEGLEDDKLQEAMKDLEINGINKLIEDKLILSKANEIGLEIREQLIDERVEKIKAKYPSEQVFLEALIQHGANLSDLRNKIQNQLKINFIIDHEVKSKIYVNPQDVTEYYEQNRNDFQKNERANLESIYIAFGDDQEKATQKIEEALNLLKEGKEFLEVFTLYSDTPSIGIVEKGQLLPAIEEAVFNLAVGETSSPIRIDNGIYIFHLKGKVPPEIASLKEVKDSIYQLIYKMKFRKNFTAWLDKLKKQAYVEIKQ